MYSMWYKEASSLGNDDDDTATSTSATTRRWRQQRWGGVGGWSQVRWVGLSGAETRTSMCLEPQVRFFWIQSFFLLTFRLLKQIHTRQVYITNTNGVSCHHTPHGYCTSPHNNGQWCNNSAATTPRPTGTDNDDIVVVATSRRSATRITTPTMTTTTVCRLIATPDSPQPTWTHPCEHLLAGCVFTLFFSYIYRARDEKRLEPYVYSIPFLTTMTTHRASACSQWVFFILQIYYK